MANYLTCLCRVKHLLAGAVVLSIATSACFSQPDSIFLISSENNSAYLLAEQGFRSTLDENHSLRVFNMNNGKTRFPFKLIDKKKPKVIVTIGTLASKTAYLDSKEGNINSPIIISMVLSPQINRIYASRKLKVSGVVLDIPYRRQFSKLKELLPHIRNIGFFYHSADEKFIQELRDIAAEYGIRLFAEKIKNTRNINDALEKLIEKHQIDLYWPGVDVSIYTKEILQYVIHKTGKKAIPFVGHSFKYLEWGALLSFDVNYKGIGEQTGNLVRRVLSGEEQFSGNFYVPEQALRYSLNLGVARSFKIEFSDSAVERSFFAIE